MIDVVYNLFAEDGDVVAKGHTILLPPWAGVAANGEAVASAICEEHLDEATWAEFFFDSSRERLLVEILSPAEVAGHYTAEAVMKPKVTARRASDAEINRPRKS